MAPTGQACAAERAADAVVVDLVLDQRGAATRRAALLVEVRFVFLAEVLERRGDRIWRRLAEAAEAAAADVIGQLLQFFQVIRPARAVAQPFEDLQHPLGADAAEGAFATGFGLCELQEETRDVDHAIAVVENHQAAGAHDGAGGGEGRHSQSVWSARLAGMHPPEGAAKLHRLKLPAVLDAAADLFERSRVW